MEKSRKRRCFWSLEIVRQEALKYKTRSDFARNSAKAYQAAWANKWLDEICSHMKISPVYSYLKWDVGSASAEALKYSSRSEFKRENSGAYCYLQNNGLIDSACLHMKNGWKFYTKDVVIAEASKYSKRCDFKRLSNSAYKHATKNGYLEEACSHMKEVVLWSRDAVTKEAKKYNTKEDFRSGCYGAYRHAHRIKVIDDVCAHMVDGDYGFSKIKPAVMYHIEFVVDGDLVLHKVGITNRTASSRLKGMLINKNVTATILKEISFDNGKEARKLEKELHKKFVEYRYTGPNIMKNGNTELFVCDILALS